MYGSFDPETFHFVAWCLASQKCSCLKETADNAAANEFDAYFYKTIVLVWIVA